MPLSGLHRYRFHAVWDIAADPDDVYGVLQDVAGYPQWWPQVRSVVEADAGSGDLVIRSLLPLALRVRAQPMRQDPVRRSLLARISGDIVGTAGWLVRPDGRSGGCRVQFDEAVEARSPLLRTFAVVARPAFVANHALMMRAGGRGLAALFAQHDRSARAAS